VSVGAEETTRPASAWARWAAVGVVLVVIPSTLWRIPVAFGLGMGLNREYFQSMSIPGLGTLYVLGLSLATALGAFLTVGLVRPWGEVLPRWIPRVGGHPVRPRLVALCALLGAVIVTAISVQVVLSWPAIMSYKGGPAAGWSTLMTAAYAPAILWGPLLGIVTVDYVRRHPRHAR